MISFIYPVLKYIPITQYSELVSMVSYLNIYAYQYIDGE